LILPVLECFLWRNIFVDNPNLRNAASLGIVAFHSQDGGNGTRCVKTARTFVQNNAFWGHAGLFDFVVWLRSAQIEGWGEIKLLRT
jgi:hypothetical protein